MQLEAHDSRRKHALGRTPSTARADSGELLVKFPSQAFQRVMSQLERFARDPHATVLLEGESGTGKTTLSRYVHRASPRAAAPYQHVVLSTLDDGLAGSELFGHVIGAYTDAKSSRAGHFVSANGGTIFLDEIGKASLSVQQKLLHVIEYGEIRPIGSDREIRLDVRIVAAANVALEKMVTQGTFLSDLYARLSSFRVRLPSLRERRADIPILVHAYVAAHAARCGRLQVPEIDEPLMHALQGAPWPNNLRQLDATVHRLLVEADGAAVITLDHCRDDLSYLTGHARSLTADVVDDALTSAGTVSGAARILGVDRGTVYRFQRKRRAD